MRDIVATDRTFPAAIRRKQRGIKPEKFNKEVILPGNAVRLTVSFYKVAVFCRHLVKLKKLKNSSKFIAFI